MSRARFNADDLRTVVHAAYVEGYIQGSMHPRGVRVIAKAEDLARLFWRVVEERAVLSRRRSVSEGARPDE